MLDTLQSAFLIIITIMNGIVKDLGNYHDLLIELNISLCFG
jgi:hypothetical protein